MRQDWLLQYHVGYGALRVPVPRQARYGITHLVADPSPSTTLVRKMLPLWAYGNQSNAGYASTCLHTFKSSALESERKKNNCSTKALLIHIRGQLSHTKRRLCQAAEGGGGAVMT